MEQQMTESNHIETAKKTAKIVGTFLAVSIVAPLAFHLGFRGADMLLDAVVNAVGPVGLYLMVPVIFLFVLLSVAAVFICAAWFADSCEEYRS